MLRSCALLAGAGPEPCAGSGVQCAVVVLGGLGSARTNQEAEGREGPAFLACKGKKGSTVLGFQRQTLEPW